MFYEMRRKGQQLNNTEALKILSDGEYGVLGTVGENGYPYTTPVNYVLADNIIFLHCSVEGHKLDNIRFNNKVSFCVVNKSRVVPDKFSTEYESVIVFGRASIIEGDAEKKEALIKLVDKYAAHYQTEGIKAIENAFNRVKVIKIITEKITGKRNVP